MPRARGGAPMLRPSTYDQGASPESTSRCPPRLNPGRRGRRRHRARGRRGGGPAGAAAPNGYGVVAGGTADATRAAGGGPSSPRRPGPDHRLWCGRPSPPSDTTASGSSVAQFGTWATSTPRRPAAVGSRHPPQASYGALPLIVGTLGSSAIAMRAGRARRRRHRPRGGGEAPSPAVERRGILPRGSGRGAERGRTGCGGF